VKKNFLIFEVPVRW